MDTDGQPFLEIEIREGPRGPMVVVRLVGELDLATVDQLDEAVGRVDTPAAGGVVVDATGLDFVDSTGLRGLLIARSRIEGNGAAFWIVPSPTLRRLLDVSGVTDEVRLADTVEQAVDGVGDQTT